MPASNGLEWEWAGNVFVSLDKGGRHNMPRPLQVELRPFDLESGAESRVTWATSVPILVFLGLSVLDLGT